jgi:hypothetical protein
MSEKGYDIIKFKIRDSAMCVIFYEGPIILNVAVTRIG